MSERESSQDTDTKSCVDGKDRGSIYRLKSSGSKLDPWGTP